MTFLHSFKKKQRSRLKCMYYQFSNQIAFNYIIVYSKIHVFFFNEFFYLTILAVPLDQCIRQKESMLNNKQGHTLKNCVEGVSDEAFYPWESPKESFDSSINGNLRLFQNHRKQAKINVFFIIFHH